MRSIKSLHCLWGGWRAGCAVAWACALALQLWCGLAAAAVGPESDPSNVYWDDRLYGCDMSSGDVYALTQDNAGNIFAGGSFTTAGSVNEAYLARWDGTAWSALGSGVDGEVHCLVCDGEGNLYVGGDFTTAGGVAANKIAKWDGNAWSPLGTGMNNEVQALARDGGGNLYAGGYFTTAGGVTVNGIAKWDGAAWSALGTGVNGQVYAMVCDGSGNIYTGGSFTTAGGVTVNRIGRWDGSAWSALGTGMNVTVEALALDGSGNLYAGGYFTTAGGLTAWHIAKWNGSEWSALGSGTNSSVRALTVDGSGNLYAGGYFGTAGGVTVNGIAKWNGSAWSAIGSGMNNVVFALAFDGYGSLCAGGRFTTAGGVAANRVAKWDGSAWSVFDTTGRGTNNKVSALAFNGDDLYAGGNFTVVDGTAANYIAKWDGAAWSALGSGMNDQVHAVACGGSDNLYVGGKFTTAGSVTVNRITKWDGSTWSALGSGVDNNVYALATDGSGNLYAGGDFVVAGGVTANRIAKWDGSTWAALGAGMSGRVSALALDGAGNVYAGGSFLMAGGVTANKIAKWDGSTWAALGAGMSVTGSVHALALDGNGNLYAGGNFWTAGDITAYSIAKWNGSTWSTVGTGAYFTVDALALDGSGDLYAGGSFTMAGGVYTHGIGKWDGSAWSAFGTGMGHILGTAPFVSALAIRGNNLYAGGDFVAAGDKVSAYFALWQPRVDHSEVLLSANPGEQTLGNDLDGFYKPALQTFAGTTVTHSGWGSVTVTLDRADEIHVAGQRVNGAFTLLPEGVQFGGAGATLRVEFSEDDVAAYGVDYSEFRAVRLTYPAGYPDDKAAAGVDMLNTAAPTPIRIENGRQIYAITVPLGEIASTYGAVPYSFVRPSAATNPDSADIATNTITWTWQDNSDNETGFKVYVDEGAGSPITLRITTECDSQSWPHNGLDVNTQYAMQVAATNAGGDSALTTVLSAWTLAAQPVAPVISSPGNDSLDVAVGTGDGNPAYTDYSIRIEPGVGGNNWVQVDGTVGAGSVYQTAAMWGTKTVTGLAEYVSYSFTVTAQNGAGVATPAGPPASAMTDGTPPTGTLVINGGAAFTNSTSVSLTLSATDSGSGVTQMQFSNDDAAWSGSEDYAGSKSWTLTAGDGAKTVYVQYRDAQGNVSTGTISDSITLDLTPPIITLLGPNPLDLQLYDEYIDPGATATDALSGDCTSGILIDSSAVDTTTIGEYVVTYDVADACGNPAHAERVVRVIPAVPLSPWTGLVLSLALAGLGIYIHSCAGGRRNRRRNRPSGSAA